MPNRPLPLPTEVFVDGDGDLRIEWDYGPRCTLIVFYHHGDAGYAALLGSKSEHGKLDAERLIEVLAAMENMHA